MATVDDLMQALGWRRFDRSESVRCHYAECTALLCWRGMSGREVRIGRLDPPFIVQEHDGSETRETHCLCVKNELGLRRLFLVRGDAALFQSFFDRMTEDTNPGPLERREVDSDAG